ncbi:HD family phosphohydrolase [Facklamia sp. P13069]|uniref:HD family phosphohydrolase n=1 Tax=Facklamia sp. P13069 TaxID=3421954 RepID=UPI003D180679
MNRRLQLLHERLGKVFIPLITFILSLAIFLIGYQHVKPEVYHFELNQVADETILAPVTMEDVEQTKANQQRAKDAINDIYLYQEDIRIQEITRIEQFFGFVREARNGKYSRDGVIDSLKNASKEKPLDQTFNEKVNNLPTKKTNFDNLSEEQKRTVIQAQLQMVDENVFNLFDQLSNRSIDQVFKISPLELSELQSNLTDFISESLAQELGPDQVDKELDKYRLQITSSDMSELAQQTTLNFLGALIKPTMVYSESETNRLKEEAASKVQTSYILQGQVIVQEGHIINQNNMRQLEMFGYLDASTKQYLMPVFVLLIFVHAFLFVYIFSDKLNWTDLSRANMQATAYMIIVFGSLIMAKMGHFFQQAGLEYGMLLLPLMILPGYLKEKSSYKVTLLAFLFINIFAIFIVSDLDNQTVVTFISLFYLFTTIVSVLLTTFSDRQAMKVEKRVALNIIWQFIIALPLMAVLTIPILSRQAFIILIMTIAANLLGLLLIAVFEPYWEQLLSSRSAMTMNQLANLNHPLLKLLIEKAPGTYHHSIMVANLAANAVEAIGGDSLTTRVASYYHDVGKTVHPLFFVENLSGGIESPHRMVGPDESAKIIIDHVAQGVKLLEEYRMPQSVIDLCKEHHGTTMTSYFYYQAKEQKMPINPETFRYPGPIPQSKESAIVMIADSMEAASRTMKEHTQKSIEELLDSIIASKINDGQFADCGLTVDELKTVRKSLILGIASMYHTRVEYPK